MAPSAVVLSIEDYRALVGQKPDFKSYLLGGPKVDDFATERDRTSAAPSISDPWRRVTSSTPILFRKTRKRSAAPDVAAFLRAADSMALFISVLTLGELRKGAAARRRTDPMSAGELGLRVDGIETAFADRVLSVDAAAARIWGELSSGRSLPVIDALIAATAIAGRLTLVTRNTRDVASTGVPLLDPWQDPSPEI
jgi:toxin FitB